MPAGLLERDAELAVLDNAATAAVAGAGAVVLLSGEAGIGKTSLLRAFVRAAPPAVRVLAGACDDLLTPRTFGPLHDAVRPLGGPLAEALRSGDRDRVLSESLALLAESPTVLVVEDAHWADDATLDVLRFVGRRIADLPAVLVMSYRDDEIDRNHPLQRVLGALGGEHTHRLRPARLSRMAVARLAGGTAATSRPSSPSLQATRSSSPRRSPPRATPSRRPSSTPFSPGSGGSTGRRRRRWSSWPSCPTGSSWPRRASCWATCPRWRRPRTPAWWRCERVRCASGTSWLAAPSSARCR